MAYNKNGNVETMRKTEKSSPCLVVDRWGNRFLNKYPQLIRNVMRDTRVLNSFVWVFVEKPGSGFRYQHKAHTLLKKSENQTVFF
jgi:hypothetical protein